MSIAMDHLDMARQYLDEAFKLLERGNPFDAAEKVWTAVKHATIALTMRVLGGQHLRRGFHGGRLLRRLS